jgi:hypothetical protein
MPETRQDLETRFHWCASSSLTLIHGIMISFVSDSQSMDLLLPRNSVRAIVRSLEQPLVFTMCISPIILFADTSLHKLEIGKGPMLEVSQLPSATYAVQFERVN